MTVQKSSGLGRARTSRALTVAELEALGVSTDVPTAGRAFGYARDASYDLVRRGEFPCAVLRVGGRYVVPVAGLRRALGLDPAAA